MHRVSVRYACTSSRRTALHHCYHTKTATALYRVGADYRLGRRTEGSAVQLSIASVDTSGADHCPGETLDTDDPEHTVWLFQKALERAKEFNIPGVTYSLTQGVIKNIIPAIAATNSIIAASCCNEAFKIATSTNPYLNNYMMYSGDDSIYTYTFEHQKKDDCPVCGNLAKTIEVDKNWTLQELIDKLGETPEAYYAHCPDSSVAC